MFAASSKAATIGTSTKCQPYTTAPCLFSVPGQPADFLQSGGTFVNVCGSQPCHSSDWAP